MASFDDKPGTDTTPHEVQSKDLSHNSHHGNEEGSKELQKSSSLAGPLNRATTTPDLSTTSSTVNSPKPSREASPSRPQPKSAASANSRMTRSRKNSQDFSPNRGSSTSTSNIPTIPSAAAIQRALSVAGTPQLQPSANQDSKIDASKSQRPVKGSNLTPQAGGIPPRLKSPPPPVNAAKASLAPQRKSESAPTTPSITLERATPATLKPSLDQGTDGDREIVPSGMRTPGRVINAAGPTLETVQESSLPTTPAIGTGRLQNAKQVSDERAGRTGENPMEDSLAKDQSSNIGSGNETGVPKMATKPAADLSKDNPKPTPPTSSAKPQINSKKSFTQLLPTKAKVQEGSAKNMIVETETVSTIPQVALGGGAGERNFTGRTDTGGSLRLKPSNETIRPKKEKKRAARKAPSINSGTASSKADIFEQKVASAMDQTNSSDSEETFVYESNPPEPPLSARPNRFHSRTPSATSTISQLDQHGRTRQDGHHSVVGKKSMKFASNSYQSFNIPGDDDQGTVRRQNGGRPGNASHHHHIGRYGRGGGGHTSLFDNDSPFHSANKQARTSTGNVARFSPRPSTPRSPHMRVVGSPKKMDEPMLYDLEGEGADDERAPLMGSVRTGRNRRRPIPGTMRTSYVIEEGGSRTCRRVTAYTVLGSILALIIFGIVAVLVMCSKPLYDVRIKDIRNVLASEQEIMLDLHVHAVNPNLISIQVSDLDVNIFAKSKHVGTSALWRNGELHLKSGPEGRKDSFAEDATHRINHRKSPHGFHTADGVDEGTDPIEDPATDSQTMLLGRIFEFDSPLIFEPSPIRRHSQSSMGEVRLAKPGNKTEEGGTARWEKVILHDFELIVRGVIKYSLPISSRTRSASIGGNVLVHPGEGLDPTGSMIISTPRRPYSPGSNVLLDRPGGIAPYRARLVS